MKRSVDAAKDLVKAAVPDKLLDPLWVRVLQAKSKSELTVAKSLVGSPEELEAIQRKHAPANNVEDFLTIGWLRRRVADVEDPALKSYFAVIADDIVPSLCAPAHCYRALINSVIAVSVQSNLEIGYATPDGVTFISNYAQLLRDLHTKAFSELHLRSGESELVVFIERWQVQDDVLVAPRPNPITRKIYLDSPSATKFLDTPGESLNRLYPTPLLEECEFEIDVVYTWVNSKDPEWQAMLAEYSEPTTPAAPTDEELVESLDGEAEDRADAESDRFLNRDELKYSLRSLLHFAPWVRTVYVVSNCKPPGWFDETNERVKWVYHEEIFDPEDLPTFSSHAIEAAIHRVPNLGEHFLYFNDDLFLVKPVKKSDYFLPNGMAKTRPEPYGMVHGELDENDPDYLNAARNVQALLQAEFGKTATKLHTHTPQSGRLSVMQACEATFPEAYKRTRSNKFRSIDDISPTSFMYPSFAYLTGNAVMDYPLTSLVNNAKPFRKILNGYRASINAGEFDELPLSLCINDGGGSTEDEVWNRAVVRFMRTTFDGMSDAEKPYGSVGE